MHRLLLSLLLLPCLAAVAAAAPELTLQQAQLAALELNLELRAAGLQLRGRTAEREGAGGVYDPLLTLETEASRNSSRINSSSLEEQRTEGLLAGASLSQKLPSGAELALGLVNERNRSPRRVINPSFDGEVSLSLTQPLLRNFGREATEGGILRAQRQEDLSWFDLQAAAAGVLQRVRDTWFDILRLQQNLELRQASLTLARRLEEDNRARVEAGLLPPVELLSAQVGVQLRLREARDAERELRDALDQLALLLQQPVPERLTAVWPTAEELRVDPQTAFDAAMHHRPELLRGAREVERAELEERLAANAARPQLDAAAVYAHQTLEDNWGDSLTELRRDELNRWSIGLTFSYPLNNREREGALAARRLETGRSRVLYRQQQEEVKREIQAALRLVEVSRQQVDTARLEGELAEERLRILLERQRVGLATVTDVLEGERDLTDARTRLSLAQADYQRARTAYLAAVGSLLEETGMQLSRPASSTNEPRLAPAGKL